MRPRPWLAGLALALLAVPRAPGLELSEVLERVRRYHPKLQGAALLVDVARAKRTEKRGAFDPTLSYKSERQEYLDKPDDKVKNKSQVAVDWMSPNGIKWYAGGRLSDSYTEATRAKKGVDDFQRFFIGAKVPLVRNLGTNAKNVAARQAALGVPRSEAEQREAELMVLLDAVTAYWDWVAADRALRVAEDIFEISMLRVQQIEDQVSAGAEAEVVLVEARREVEKRRGGLVKARRYERKAAFKLAMYLWGEGGDSAGPPARGEAPDFPDPRPLPDAGQIRQAELDALAARPELARIDLDTSITRLDLALAKNDRRPDVELFYNPGRDTALDVIEPLERRLKAGIKVSVPLRRRSADGRAAQSRRKLEKLELEAKLAQQEIRIQVQDAVNEIELDREALAAATREVEFALDLEARERERFRLGDGTLFYVNQRERYRAEAQVKAAELAAELEKAWGRYLAVTGRLREDRALD